MQKQEQNTTDLCQHLHLDRQIATLVSERLDLHKLSLLLDLVDIA
jgi:hypothetical protein